MVFTRAAKLAGRCAAVEAAVRGRDGRRMARAVPRLWQAAQQASGPELDEALPRCAALLPELGVSAGGQFALLCGALVALGARPDPLVDPVADGLADALARAERFRAGWRQARAGARPPSGANSLAVADAVAAMVALHGPREEAERTALAWFAAGKWATPATTLSQRSAPARAAFRDRPGLVRAAGGLVTDLPELAGLVGLLRLLEREQLLVLHRRTGRGWWVTIDGVGDNVQLHTLLAGAFGGPPGRGPIDGLAVAPTWPAAREIRAPGGVVGGFTLVDGYGSCVRDQGIPADIPLFDGVRVVALDPPPDRQSGTNLRRYPMLAGSATVDGALPPAEAKAWLARIAPGGEST